ncbi:hypothetical protein L1987_33785 [Smallanthus sonchifolius]|uniref:Uncharacterized protein n=1 Tax=Smallanthus sonchifolius TaxID=185202 RepID=A0ACB9HST3_9ASTR|nr:hypothetical protein L1987_33785 [Smallanthus sonchifolius]
MDRRKPIHPQRLVISMAIISIFFISLLIFIHPPSSATATTRRHRIQPPSIKDASSPSDLIQQACKATRYQQLCESSLTPYPNGNAIQIIQSELTVSFQNLRQAQSMAQSILEASDGNLNRITAAKNCIEHLNNSGYRIESTVDALPRGEMKNGRTWTSAGLAYQYDCWSALKYVNDTKMINETMSFLNTLIGYTSNALSMMMAYDVFGVQTASWKPPKTERDGFWESGGESGGVAPELGVPVGLKADVTVCKGGGCDYATVQEAVDAAPDWGYGRRFVVWVKEGFYEETVRIGIEKQNVVVLGDGMGKTVISGSLNVGQPGLSTYNTATFDCTVLVRPRQLKPEKGENNAVTAHGRIDPAQSTGFVFQNCLINGTEEYMRLYNSKPKVHKNFLGRPWKEFSRTVFIDCNLEALIAPQGWMPWKGDFALKTLYYGESGNSGKGSDLSGRVNWSSRIPADHVDVYTAGNFLQGDQWRVTSS